jgi:phosphonate transport system substrate-binding protein
MKIRTWAAFVAAGALLAACGGNADTDIDLDTDTDTGADTEDGSGDDVDEDAGEGAAGDEEWPESIVLGLVPSQDVDELVETAQPLADLLAEELGIEVESFVPTDYSALVVAMQTGQADIGAFGPIALAQSVDQAGAVPVLQSIRRGAATYHTQWFTNDPDRFCLDEVVTATNPEGNDFAYCNGTDSASEGPVGEEALELIEEGETIFFVDVASASGYYYPATQLQQVAGLDPFTQVDAQFAGGHPNAALGVLRGEAAVGTSYDDVRNDLLDEEPTIGEDLVVFAWSTEIPNDGISVSNELPQSLIDAITEAFLAVADTDEGLQALLDVYSIEGLVPVDLDAVDEARQVAANFGD